MIANFTKYEQIDLAVFVLNMIDNDCDSLPRTNLWQIDEMLFFIHI
jgi:hypothetical protein